jgi:hypothetical protein
MGAFKAIHTCAGRGATGCQSALAAKFAAADSASLWVPCTLERAACPRLDSSSISAGPRRTFGN